jgi:hypothetical protein
MHAIQFFFDYKKQGVYSQHNKEQQHDDEDEYPSPLVGFDGGYGPGFGLCAVCEGECFDEPPDFDPAGRVSICSTVSVTPADPIGLPLKGWRLNLLYIRRIMVLVFVNIPSGNVLMRSMV